MDNLSLTCHAGVVDHQYLSVKQTPTTCKSNGQRAITLAGCSSVFGFAFSYAPDPRVLSSREVHGASAAPGSAPCRTSSAPCARTPTSPCSACARCPRSRPPLSTSPPSRGPAWSGNCARWVYVGSTLNSGFWVWLAPWFSRLSLSVSGPATSGRSCARWVLG